MDGTSILDSETLRWDDPRIRNLRDALAAACDHPDHIRELVQSIPGFPANDLNLYQNPLGSNAIWKEVMFAAAKARALRPLLEVVLADKRILAHHDGIRAIIAKLDGSNRHEPDDGTLPRSDESISITNLGTILATELEQLSGQLIEQVQRLAACGDRFEIALAATTAATITERISEALKSIDKIGLGKAAETPEDDRDNAYRREIRRELENFSSSLSGAVASRGNTVSVTGLAATADRIRQSAIGLADLRARRHHPE